MDTPEAKFYNRISALKKRFDSAIRSKINPATGQRYKTSEVYAKTMSKLDVFEFMANLSEPTFIKLAKEILVIPKGGKKSILKEILEAIAEFFSKWLGLDVNVYDATIKTLEDYYNLLEETNAVTPLAAEIDMPKSLDISKSEIKERLTNALNVSDSFLFESNLEYIKNNLLHVIDVDSLPGSFGEEFDLELNPEFEKLNGIDELSMLNSIKLKLSDLNFAYYAVNPDVSMSSPGGIITTRALTNAVDNLFADEALNNQEKNLLRSMIIKAATDNSFIDNVIAAGDDALALGDYLYANLFSQADKAAFMVETNTRTDREAHAELFLQDSNTKQSILKVSELITRRYDEVSALASAVEDRSANRFIQAKNFVLAVLRKNLDKDKTSTDDLSHLIKDRQEVIDDIRKMVSSPNAVLPSGLTIRDALTQLNAYYAEVRSLKELKRLSAESTNRLHDLLYKLVPSLEDEVAGITALKDTDKRLGSPVLDEIIKDIYPKYNLASEEQRELALELAELAEAEHVSKDIIDDEIKETSNISEYLKEYNKSYELTLSESIKDYLSHMRVGDRTISNALAYIKTIQLATSLDWTQGLSSDFGNDLLTQLRNRLRNESGLSNLDKTIVQSMIDIIVLAVSTRYPDVNISTGLKGSSIGIVSTVSNKGITLYYGYQITDPTISNAQHLSYDEILNLSRNNNRVELSSPSYKTIDLYQWLKTKHADLTVRQFNRLFTKADAINVIRGIHNTMASMKETELYIATRSMKQGLSFRMIRSKASGISYSIKDVVRYNLFAMYEGDKLTSLGSAFRNKKVGDKTMSAMSTGTAQEKETFIREFFNEIGFKDVASNIAIRYTEVNDLINQINGFLDKTSNVVAHNAAMEFSDEGNTTEKPPFQDWIDDEVGGYINRFSELLAKSDELFRNPSVRDSKGNKFYKFHESSWAYDVFNNLIDLNKGNAVFQGGTGNNTERRVPDYLLSSFYDHNIFARGKIFNRIYSIGEYEAAKSEDTGAVTPYTRENMYYFFHRKFVQGFLDGFRQYRDSYFQFTYIPSDKPKHPLLRVGLLSDNTKLGKSPIHKSIEQALTQILEKQNALGKLNIANYDNSLTNDKFRNFQLGKVAVDNLKIDFTEDNIPKIADEVYRLMSEQASTLLDELLSSDISLTFDKSTYSIMRYMKDKLNPKFALPEDLMANTQGQRDAKFKNKANKEYAVKKEEILPMFDLFFKNNYVNSYFLNQIVAGDYAAYKKDSSDIVKRFAGVFGPGLKPLVDATVGMQQKFKIMVLADTVVPKESTRARFVDLFFDGNEPSGKALTEFEEFMEFFDDKFESTDAQGFMLPRRHRQLTRGFEKSWGLGQVHKPMHFEVRKHEIKDKDGNVVYSTAIPVYLKYSAIVLDEALTSRFPLLAALRDKLERLDVDEAIFNSGVKEGMPIVIDADNNVRGKSFTFTELLDMSDDDINDVRLKYANPPILELDNRNYRLQHNPQADPNKRVSLFTQLMYFLNVYPDALQNGTYGTTQDAAQEAYSLVGELIKMGRESFLNDVSDPRKLRSFLLKKFEGPGAERALDLLQNGISVNHPLLEKRTIISLASGLEQATVKVKFSGGKLVLQTAEGIEKYRDSKLFVDNPNLRNQELSYRKESIEINGITRDIMVAEVIVPKEMLTTAQIAAIGRKESIYLLPDAMGFRIPSTELHSALPLRVVGVYSAKQTNVIIAPKELVPIHGSDFDVDALFVITKELFSPSESTVLGVSYISEYLNSLRQVFDELSNAEANLSSEGIVKLRKLKSDIKKLSGLMNELDQVEEPTLIDQNSTEESFKTYVSTPQLEKGSARHYVTLVTRPDYNEARARANWGADNGLRWSPSDKIWIKADSIRGKLETIRTRINKFLDVNPEFEIIVAKLLEVMNDFEQVKSRTKTSLLGEANSPVGYELVDGKYILNENYLETLNTNITELEAIKAGLQPELAPLIMREVNSDLKNLKSLKDKYIKNRIMDIMLTVISDWNNKYRMTTPINFRPLTDAIANIPQELVGDTSYDLSNLNDEYRAYAALVSGTILTGAFANASKTFGYFARSGATPELQKYYDILGNLRQQIKLIAAGVEIPDIAEQYEILSKEAARVLDVIKRVDRSVEAEDVVAQELPESASEWVKKLTSLRSSLLRNRSKANRVLFAQVDSSPLLNRELVFDINHSNGLVTYDRLSIKDSQNKWTITQVYDALTNEAIDNLKLGDLVKARINPNTGSAVIGLVALGVPMDTIIKLLYQPILAKLSSGKIDNVDRWIQDMDKQFGDSIIEASIVPVDEANDLEKFLRPVYHSRQKMTTEQLMKSLTEDDVNSQLRALGLFMKGYRIGQDMRATSNFLNVIRQQDVFIEDILQNMDNVNDNIGKPMEVDGAMVLSTDPKFSFVIPNLLENAPHVREAYQSQLDLINVISGSVKIHSPEIVAFSDSVYTNLRVLRSYGEKAQSKKATIRRSLSYYTLSGIAVAKLKNVSPQVIKVGDTKLTISPLRSFSNSVANNLWKIKEFAAKDGDPNLFLRNVSIVRDTISLSRIAFKSGVNLNSEDVRNIVLGFKNLNQYDVNENGVVSKIIPPYPNYVSKLQQELLDYAILNYGLQFSSSNYSAYIPASILERIDDLYNMQLDRVITNVRNGSDLSGLANHFVLSHILQNASSLPYISNEAIVPFKAAFRSQTDKLVPAVYPGKKVVKTQRNNLPVELTYYYDLEVSKTVKDSDVVVNAEQFIRTDFGDNVRVYTKVGESDTSVFYKKVGKVSDVFHTPLEWGTPYDMGEYFNPEVAELEYHYLAENKAFTFSKLVNSLKRGDKIWIYPNYNFDRTQRQFVEIEDISTTSSNDIPGFYITFKSAEAPVTRALDAVDDKPRPARVPKLSNPSFARYTAEEIFSNAKKDEVTGDYDLEGSNLVSVTQAVIPLFQSRPFTSTDTRGKRLADAMWKGLDPETQKRTDMSAQPLTRDEYERAVDASYETGIAKGTIFHKLFHQYISKDPITAGELQELYAKHNILPSEFDWLDGEAMRSIIRRTGTNYLHNDINLRTDKIYTEKTVASKLLGWAGTVDLWIDHGDDVHSIYDVKTGRAFNRIFEHSFLKYGRTSTSDIFDTPRNRAKLQLMLYAFIAKTENPNARFRNLELLHIKDKWSIGEVDAMKRVNVPAFLEIIEGTLKNEQPEIYKKLKALPHFTQLFEASSYDTADIPSFENVKPGSDPAMILKMKVLELQSLVMYDKDIISGVLRDDRSSKERYKAIEKLMEEIIKLRNDQSISYASWDTDMGWMDRWLGSASSSTNPYVKLYYRMLTESKQQARDKYLNWREQFDGFIRRLQKESGLKPAQSLIGGTNREALFGFALKQTQVGEDIHTRFITEKDTEFASLNDTQKAFVTFANNSIGMFFDNKLSDFEDPTTGKKVALANRVVTYRKRGSREVAVTNLDLYNKTFDINGSRKEKFSYTRGFFPKHPPTTTDITNKDGFMSKNLLRFVWNRYMTNYFEATYDGWYNTDEAIPMKYLGGNGVETTGNYSLNVELAIDSFVKQHYYKQYLDQTYAFGQGMKLYLTAKENAGQGVTFDRLINWFEENMNLSILGRRQKELKLNTRTFGRVKNGQYMQFNAVKFLRSIKGFFVGPTMWLKPLTGLPNFVFASLVTLKEGLKGSLGLAGANANFDLGDMVYGFSEAFKLYFWDGLSNESYRKSKAYLLMEKTGYLPDSYDWYTRPNQLLTSRNKLFTSRTMMLFHSLPEEIISTAIFVAQMRAMKFKKADGTNTNMWDAYDTKTEHLSDGTEFHTIEWTGGKRGVRNVSNVANQPVYEDVTELTVEEINALKFLYEKMHGGYRIDERVAAEYYIWGEMILQLKKFLPSMLKNVWASRGVRDTQGRFEEITDENGNKVLKWNASIIEGRWRLILGLLFNKLAIDQSKTVGKKGNKVLETLGFQFDESYKWDNLSETQKEDVKDFILTSSMWMVMLLGYFNLWDMDDEDTFKKLYGRIMNDFSGAVNPWEIMKNVVNMTQPVAARKGYKLMESSAELFWSTTLYAAGFDDEALTKAGNLRGWSEFQRNIHFLSSYHDLNKGVNESELLKEMWGERLK